MPKGFNRKGIEGFTQWMTSVLGSTNLDKSEAERTVEKTRQLLEEGFPQIRGS